LGEECAIFNPAVLGKFHFAPGTATDKRTAAAALAELQALIPDDPRLPGWRTGVAALPWGQTANVDLGGGVSMEFVLVGPGSFRMGSETGAADEIPVHTVALTTPFYLGRYEVTQEQWEAVAGTNPSLTTGARLPVTGVSWDDCQDIAAILTDSGRGAGGVFRLPTEAEWEYACRGGTTTAFSFGDAEADLDEYAWFSGNSGGRAHEVGTRRPNPWGLYDMHGNVWEWCQDWYGAYPDGGEATAPNGAAGGSIHVFRGGGWGDDPAHCRSAYRGFAPGNRYTILGCRLVLVPPTQESWRTPLPPAAVP